METQLSPLDNFKRSADLMRNEVAKHYNGNMKAADNFLRATITYITMNERLLNCTPKSLWSAVMRACQDGLMVDGKMALINSYKDTASYQPMLTGIVRLVYRAGYIVTPEVVYKGDYFKFSKGDDSKIIHNPAIPQQSKDIEYSYAIFRDKDTGVIIHREVMAWEELEKIQKESFAKLEKQGKDIKNSPWYKWPDQMCRKSAISRGSKYVDKTPQLESAIQADYEAQGFQSEQPKEKTVTPSSEPSDLLKELGLKKGTDLPIPESKEEKPVTPDDENPFDSEEEK